MSKRANTWFGKLDVPDFLGSVQLLAILGTADLLRKVLSLSHGELLRHNQHYPVEKLGRIEIIIIIIIIVSTSFRSIGLLRPSS